MKPLRFVALWAVTSTSVLVAQDHPEVAGINNPLQSNPPALVWGQTTDEWLAALRWVEQPGEYTLLMVHTTIDTEKSGPLLAKGICKTLPFLVSPVGAGWDDQAPELARYQIAGQAQMIPPVRVAAFVDQFVQSDYAAGYGTHNSTSQPVLRHAAASHFAAFSGGLPVVVTDPTDERQPWLGSSWYSALQSGQALPAFDSVRLGRASVLQMAEEFAERHEVSFDFDSIEMLLQQIDKEHGFEIYVQAIAVRPPVSPGDKIQLEYKRFTRIRRHSLFVDGNLLALGLPRHVPDPFDADQRLYLAPRGDEMHIVFPFQVNALNRPPVLRAYVPTLTGYMIVPQIANPTIVVAGIEMVTGPNTARFAVPVDAIRGIVWFEDVRFLGTAVVPSGAVDLGACISAYE